MYQFAFVLTHPKQAAAFTLIELSVVLVVIGLVVGGVLVGQDLIAAANMRAQISQIEKFEVAATTFKLKYNCLPGDCETATNFFGAIAQPEQVTNGNGNKKIEGIGNVSGGGVDGITHAWHTRVTDETMRGFDHLAAARLVSLPQYDETDATIMGVPGKTFPKSPYASRGDLKPDHRHWSGLGDANGQLEGPYGTMIGYQIYDADLPHLRPGHYVRFGVRELQSGIKYLSGKAYLNPWDAQLIDEKMDDGAPYSGRVMIAGLSGSYVSTFGAPIHCATKAPSDLSGEYRSSANLVGSWTAGVVKGCSMMVKTNL